MNQCPYCQETRQQVKAGLNDSGSQRWRCKACGRRYTPEPTPQGYSNVVCEQAMQMTVDGVNLRRIARQLKDVPAIALRYNFEGSLPIKAFWFHIIVDSANYYTIIGV